MISTEATGSPISYTYTNLKNQIPLFTFCLETLLLNSKILLDAFYVFQLIASDSYANCFVWQLYQNFQEHSQYFSTLSNAHSKSK